MKTSSIGIIFLFISSLSFGQTRMYRPFKMDVMLGKGGLLATPQNSLYTSVDNSVAFSLEPKFNIRDNIAINLKYEFFINYNAIVLSSLAGGETYFGNKKTRPFVGVNVGLSSGIGGLSVSSYMPVLAPRAGVQIEHFRIVAEANIMSSFSYYAFKAGVTFGGGRKKPKAIKPKPQPTATENIIVSGRVLDENTNKPIKAKIIYYYRTNAQNVDSTVSSSQTGSYRLNVSHSIYNYTVVADGYETYEDLADLTNLSQNNFVINVLLKPIAATNSDEVAMKIEHNKFRLDKVYFELGSSKLLDSSFEQLNGLLNMLKESPEMKIQIEGHTNKIGDEDENVKLSLNRASNVKKYLVANGIKDGRIKVVGYGSARPISPENTEEGKALNRRVEFIILE